MKTRIHLYDTTLRDGTQREGISLSASDKVKIAARLDAFGIDTIEGGWPGSNPKDAEFFRRVAEQPPRRARISAFGSTRRVGMSCDEDPSLQALVASNTPVVTIVGKSSATHVRIVLETTREENLRLIADTVAYFRAMGKDVIYDAEHFFDGLALDEVYALETLEAAHDAGASVLVLCDTNGGAEPRVISEAVCRVSRRFRAPLGIHPHNDRGLALANALAAIDAGCVHAQGTVNGYGERCGNLDLLALIANLQLKRGVQCVSDESLATLTELSHCVASIANLAPDAHAPFIGRAAFAHKGGIHVSAVAKEPDMYQHMDPARVGNRMRIVVSELSGRANVRLRASSLGLDAQPVERAVLERVKALEHAGAQLEAAEGTFEMLVRRASPGYVVPFELREYTVVVERRANAGSRARAIVEMRIGDTSVRTQAEGDGPVHALDSAVRLALAPHIPAVLDSQLVDYKVRIIDEHLGTAAITRVLIETSYGAERWSTIGAAANLLDASWDAIRDSLELVVARSFDATRHSAPHRMETRRIDRNRHVMMHTMPRTLFAKLWDDHLIQAESESTPAVLYVDLHLVHEVTSPQAFSVLRERGVRVRRTERTLATMDHSTPTTPRGNDGKIPVLDLQARAQLAQLEQNCADFDVPLYTLGSEHQGIVHVIGPELGFTQPGMTIVCGDSHTSTHGDSGALAFGIGTSEVAHVLATQCLLQRRAQTMEVRVDGTLAPGVTAKDLILRLISEIGVGGATGHVLEYTGSAIRALSMEERMTVCNMSIEAGARAGMIAPDDTTYQYLAGRPHAPRGEAWDRALARWRTFTADPGSMHDRTVMLDATSIKPMITYGTNPGMGIAVDAPVPTPSEISDASERRALEKALAYMALQPGEMLLGKPVDVVFLGSCTNSRISDLRLAAAVMRGHRVASTVRMLVVPGSQQVKRQAEAEGLDVIFHAAGAEWREAGCSMCIAMNGDELRPGQYAVSTSNRNFEGRQGKGGRTFLASPLTAAATAIAGSIADARTIVQGN